MKARKYNKFCEKCRENTLHSSFFYAKEGLFPVFIERCVVCSYKPRNNYKKP